MDPHLHIYCPILGLVNGSPADFFWEFEGIEIRGPANTHVVSGYDGGLQ